MPSDGMHRKQELEEILETSRLFLRGELDRVDPALPDLVAVLRRAGAGECWHKHGSFLDHLLEVYRILKIWSSPDVVARCGLFHSAYSNSYVNLAIFDPKTSRDHVRSLIGDPAERLVHLFCVVPRQTLIHDDLLFRYSDSDLTVDLEVSRVSLFNAVEKGVFDEEEPWRKKIRSIIPAEGITVKHIKAGDDVAVSRRVVAAFLLMTMADFSDQLFGFQDELFENDNARLEFSGNNYKALWPGSGKPGLWMNSISRMGALYSLIVREEMIYLEERKRRDSCLELGLERDEDLDMVIPPVFDGCTRILSAEDQLKARDLYWETFRDKEEKEREELLVACAGKNPFVGEPRLVLAQVYLGQERFEEAEEEAEMGLKLMLEWGSCWDKRMSWEGWIAWGRVLLMKARERSWPRSSWGIVNLGLVK